MSQQFEIEPSFSLVAASRIPVSIEISESDDVTILVASNAAASHTHAISDVTGLQDALDGKAASSHTHDIADTIGLQDALDGKSATGHAHAISDVTGLQSALDGKAASSHTHTIANITNLQTTLDGKAASSHSHAISDITGLQSALDGKSGTNHTHEIADTTGLQSALDGKAAASHTHAISDVTNLQSTLNAKAAASHTHTLSDITDAGTAAGADTGDFATASHAHAISDITGLQTALNGKAASSHTHDIGDINATGTADSSTFLRGDGAWATPPAAGSPAWGDITGTLSNQTDLQAALDGKSATGHSHTLSDITDAGTAAGSDTGDFEASGAVSTHAAVTSGVHGISAYGAGIVSSVDAAAARTALGLGSAATQASTAFAAASHNHSTVQITDGTLPVIRGGTGSSSLPVVSNYTGGGNLSAHIQGIDTALGGKAAISHTHAISDVTNLQTTLDGKAASSHSHTLSDITDAGTAAGSDTGDFAAASHTHPVSQITGLKVDKSITIPDPVNGDDVSFFYTEVAITISKMIAVVRGSSPSFTFTVRHAADRSATGNELVTGGTTCTNTTTGQFVTSFDDATISANSFVWVEGTGASGTIDEFALTLIGSED